MLLCGFEKIDNYFIRIDILERLFIIIMNSNPENNKEIKLIPEMLNLLGCSKDNFVKVIKKINYKTYEKSGEIYIKYFTNKNSKKNITFKTNKKSNPFSILKQINFK